MNNAPNNPIISIKDLTKKFGNYTAVDHLSFDVQKGEIFGFLGPNGAGKTTTINLICGLLPCSEGEILFYTSNGAKTKSTIGYCPQENIYYPKLTCLEQLVFMGSLYGLSRAGSKEKGTELLTFMGLADRSNTYAGNLSGGMKRRLNICLSLMHDPEILILDEPEAGLDPQSKVMVRSFIRDFSKDKTVILTSHNMDEVERLADRVAIIDWGKLLLIDTPANLKNSIGEGDILEFELNIDNGKDLITNDLIDSLSKYYHVSYDANVIIIRSTGIIEKINEITGILNQHGLIFKEIRFHENTLEDVFIHLTGRKLRQ
jgi:ABC-2 type transport system ATP-binding protein